MDNIRILLVDDEEEFTSTLAERLQLRGYGTVTAGDGEAGLERLAKEAFDIVVLDLMMPGLGGLETLKRIKGETPGLPVILLTGHGSTREGMEGMRLGAYDYLMKPLNIDELLEKVTSAVAKTGAGRP